MLRSVAPFRVSDELVNVFPLLHIRFFDSYATEKKIAVKNLPVTFLNTFVFLGKIKKLIEPFVKFLFIEKFKMWRRLVVLYKRT